MGSKRCGEGIRERDRTMTTWITICDTCRYAGQEGADLRRTDGERLAELLERRAAGTAVKTRRVSCLMGCAHGCNLTVQAAGKISYVIGRFAPEADAADAIIRYAELHARSESGQVPYRQWPEGIKGHFIARLQPLPEDG